MMADDEPPAIGQRVRIIDRPFSDFEAWIDEINLDKGKVKVLIEVFGRLQPIEVDYLQIEQAE